MKVALWGQVQERHLDDARLFAGIEPTEFITDGRFPPPLDLPVMKIPVDPMVSGELGVRQQHCRFALNADALVMVGYDEHLLYAMSRLRVPVYQADD